MPSAVAPPPRELSTTPPPVEVPRALAPPPGLHLVPKVCCLCGVEDADPIGVGEDFEYRTSSDTFLAVRCRRCGLIYLNPQPADEEMGRIYPDHYHAFDFKPEEFGFVYRVRRRLEARRALKWCHDLPADARILDVGCGDGFHLRLLKEFGKPGWSLEGVDTDPRAVAHARAAGLTVHHGNIQELPLPADHYHLALMVMTVEHMTDPVGVLRTVRRVLKPGGKVVLVTDNAGSPDFWLFRGRHWGGYHFPRHPQLFTKSTLRKLADVSGFETERIVTPFSPVNWAYSVRNLLDDWGAPRWLVNRFTLKSTPAMAAFTLFDLPLSLVGCGAILRATFRKPAEETRGGA
ncbi:MAG: class I SAM-dependent methyltransferase [Planctomycetes bacterium]|nr:class I SAM-dependent methyltransferase [Planctomycetota bacterium]